MIRVCRESSVVGKCRSGCMEGTVVECMLVFARRRRIRFIGVVWKKLVDCERVYLCSFVGGIFRYIYMYPQVESVLFTEC